jgi:hypothetical protein
MSTSTQTRPDTATQSRPRVDRTAYFAQRDALLASGAFAIKDRRQTHAPTGRIYAD